MAKQLTYDTKARELLLNGVNTLAEVTRDCLVRADTFDGLGP